MTEDNQQNLKIQKLEDNMSYITTTLNEVRDDVKDIKNQTTQTNGKVKKHEALWGVVKWGAPIFITIIVSCLSWLFICIVNLEKAHIRTDEKLINFIEENFEIIE